MSGFSINIGLDPVSMAQAQLLNQWTTGFRPTFEGFLTQAGWDSLKALHQSAENFMWTDFQNPTGDLEDSLEENMYGPYEGWMGSESPYARRRNWGFTGMTDSLGRYFPWDGGIAYMERAIADQFVEIWGFYERAFYQALAAMGVH